MNPLDGKLIINTIPEFLEAFRPGGPWSITSIHPDTKHIATRTYTDMEKLLKFIEYHNNVEGYNMYFNVNRAYKSMDKKYEKTDVSFVDYFHVDVDLQGGGAPFDAQRKEILKALREYTPKPSIIIDSGGGYQGFWKLSSPIEVSHEEEHSNIADIEAYNNQIRIILGADATQNIDRIMRIPFTRNFPNAKKRDMGRTESKSSLVYFDDISYALSDFAKSAIVSANTSEKIDINFGSLQDTNLEDLGIPKETRLLIIHGNPTKRSEAVIAVINKLMQILPENIRYDTIASILLNKEYKISNHVLDQMHPENYIKKQIENSISYLYHEDMGKMNAQHSVVNYHGKTMVFQEVPDILFPGRTNIDKKTFKAFKEFYSNVYVNTGNRTKEGEEEIKPIAEWWLKNPLRRTYSGVIFLPNKEVPNMFNMWRGFSHRPKQGNWSIYEEHIRNNICKGDPKLYDWVLKWMARCIQKPDTVGQVALVLRGKLGVGKGVFAATLGELFGQHYFATSQSSHLTGKFNSHLQDCVLCFADEAFFAGDKQGEAVLKTIITEPTLAVEMKGIDIGPPARNFIHLIVGSNQEWTIPAGADERRFLVLDVSPEHIQDIKYFSTLENQMKAGGYEALLYDLLRINLTGFEHELRKPPKTTALYSQQILTMQDDRKWWMEKLNQGQICPAHLNWNSAVRQDQLYEDYLNFAKNKGVRYKSSLSDLNNMFRVVLPTRSTPITRSIEVPDPNGGARWYVEGEVAAETIKIYYLEFPDLDDCRRSFEKYQGIVVDWPELSDVEQVSKNQPF